MKFPLLILALTLASCTIIPTQHGKAIFTGDYTNVTFSDGSVHFHADTMMHSGVVRAHYHGLTLIAAEAVASGIPGVGVGGHAAAAGIPALVSGMTQTPRATPKPNPTKLP